MKLTAEHSRLGRILYIGIDKRHTSQVDTPACSDWEHLVKNMNI
jgi:hypothetical protein